MAEKKIEIERGLLQEIRSIETLLLMEMVETIIPVVPEHVQEALKRVAVSLHTHFLALQSKPGYLVKDFEELSANLTRAKEMMGGPDAFKAACHKEYADIVKVIDEHRKTTSN